MIELLIIAFFAVNAEGAEIPLSEKNQTPLDINCILGYIYGINS